MSGCICEGCVASARLCCWTVLLSRYLREVCHTPAWTHASVYSHVPGNGSITIVIMFIIGEHVTSIYSRFSLFTYQILLALSCMPLILCVSGAVSRQKVLPTRKVLIHVGSNPDSAQAPFLLVSIFLESWHIVRFKFVNSKVAYSNFVFLKKIPPKTTLLALIANITFTPRKTKIALKIEKRHFLHPAGIQLPYRHDLPLCTKTFTICQLSPMFFGSHPVWRMPMTSSFCCQDQWAGFVAQYVLTNHYYIVFDTIHMNQCTNEDTVSTVYFVKSG